MRRRLLLLLVPVVLGCLVPGVARANMTATYAGGVLTVTSTNAGTITETVAITQSGSSVVVTANAGLVADPDGAGGTCANPQGGTVFCSDAALTEVRVATGTGVDSITDANTSTPTLLEGGAGNDTLATLSGDTDADMRGDADDDTITSRSNADALAGGANNDTLVAAGERGFDGTETGGPGNDTFTGNPDEGDFLIAESGADTYDLGTHAPGALESPGPLLQLNYPDAVSYDASGVPVSVSLDGAANDGAAGEQDDVGADVEYVYGGSAGDVLVAGPNAVQFFAAGGADQVTGGPGPDRLNGGGGNDTVRGGDGDDQLEDGDFTPAISGGPQAAAGSDVLDGGPGDDELISDRGADDVAGGPGQDRTQLDRPIPQAPAVTTPVVPAAFTISLDDVANDGQTGTGEGDNYRSDIEVVTTAGGDDVVGGSGAANEIRTGGGNDTVNPGGGPDLVDLGAGDDRAVTEDGTTDTVRCGTGGDTVVADLAGAQAARADVLSDCEAVSGTPFPVVVPPSPPVVIAVPVPAVGDRVKPTVTLGGATIKAKDFLADGRLALTVRCDEACSVAGEAFTTLARIARAGDFSVGTGALRSGTGLRTLRITVARKYRSRFRSKLRTAAQRRRGVKFAVVVQATDAAGNTTRATRTVTVKG